MQESPSDGLDQITPTHSFKKASCMDSLTAQAQKGGTPATPPFTLYPFCCVQTQYDVVAMDRKSQTLH